MADSNKSLWSNPWTQLVFGVICMAMIANLQYGWGAFVNPIDAKYHWGRAAIQVAFTIFSVTQTWLVPVEGWLADRYGPRTIVITGGLLCAIGWIMNASADSLPLLYLAAAISGIGAGGVYGSCIGNALKWFPTQRGLATGLTAAGYGAGAALTVIPISNIIQLDGYEAAFLYFGIGQGMIVILLGLALTTPPASIFNQRSNTPGVTQYNARPMEVLQEPTFWVLYLIFVLMVAGGLMATQQLVPLAKSTGLDKSPVLLFGGTFMAMTLALSLGGVINGLTRPFFGWISDKIGREKTMFFAFLIEAASLLLLDILGTNPIAFVILTCLIFFAWGEIYSLFPATCADTFGARWATTNAGMLYTAKGTASLLIPFGTVIISATGDWSGLFYLAAIMNAIAAGLALFVLKPMRAALHHKYEALNAASTKS